MFGALRESADFHSSSDLLEGTERRSRDAKVVAGLRELSFSARMRGKGMALAMLENMNLCTWGRAGIGQCLGDQGARSTNGSRNERSRGEGSLV